VTRTAEPSTAEGRARPLTGVGLGLRWEFIDEALDEGDLESRVAFFEVSPENYMRRGGLYPDQLARLADRIPIVTHGLTMSLGGIDAFDDRYFRRLRAFVDRIAPRVGWHSDHLCVTSHEGAVLHDLLPLPFDKATAKRVAARVREASDRLERAIAIENVSYYHEPGQRPGGWREEDLLAEVLEEANCLLLLDVNNLDVNAQNHGFDALAWLDRVPLERVVEVHVAGPERWRDTSLWVDTHGAPVRESVYMLLEHVVARTGPVPVLLERDHQVPPLGELLGEVSRLRAAYERALASAPP
jgi:uncharacterized protein (UPF0276 family)